MADFVSGFWGWFIAVVTIASIVGLVLVLLGNTLSKGVSEGDLETTGHVWDDDLAELNNPLPKWWLNLFYITLIFGVVYLLLYPGLGKFQGFLGWSQIGQLAEENAAADEVYGPLYKKYAASEISALASNVDAMETGQRLFNNYCSVCHGSDARGARGFPNLRDSHWLYGGEPENIRMSILSGRLGTMPAWGAILGAQGLDEITEHVLSLSRRSPDARKAKAGEKIFQANCVACHQADGTGNIALGAPDLTDDAWLYGASRKAIQESIDTGRRGYMPPHKDFLGEDKIHLLAAYVYSIRGTD